MKIKSHPQILALVILTVLVLFASFLFAGVPANKAVKNQNKVVPPLSLKAVPFRMINDGKQESVFIGWNLYGIMRVQPSSPKGNGC